jgi:hypothetical protein
MKTAARRPCRVRKSKGAATAFNADMNNRQLHPDERRKAAELARKSGGKYTAEQIEDAMRNAGNRELGEDITAGMIVRNAEDFYDDGARFNAGTGVAVQELPNGGRVDPDLAAFIAQNTGGGNTPYYWGDVQLGKVQPPAPNPHAHLNTRQPNIHGHITPEAAAGVLPVKFPRIPEPFRSRGWGIVSHGVCRTSGKSFAPATACTAATEPEPRVVPKCKTPCPVDHKARPRAMPS